MLKVLIQTLILGVLLGASAARAELPADYKVVLLTENFPPFNMAVDDKNFARDDGIDGISADIVREMFRRAGIGYSLSLRFPWDRLYRLTLDKPGYGLFSMTYTPERVPQFKWVGPLADTSWVLLAPAGSKIAVKNLKDAARYKLGAYKNDAVSQHLEAQGIPVINALSDEAQKDIGWKWTASRRAPTAKSHASSSGRSSARRRRRTSRCRRPSSGTEAME